MKSARIQEELVQAFKQGDETRARLRVGRLGSGPRQVRAALEAMLESTDGLVRQAAAFGLGELGGAASVRRLEEQLALEEARGNYDGEAVVAEITRALGRIEEAGARTSLLKRLERMVRGQPERSAVNELALALWRRRHPDLIPAVRRAIEQLRIPAPHGLHGLLVLLEKKPEELKDWVLDPAVPVAYKTRALVVLEEDLPDALAAAVLPACISLAESLSEQAVSQDREAAYYSERLFSLLLMDREHFIAALPEGSRTALRTVACRLVGATSLGCALRAAVVLKQVGHPEDAALLERHRPADAGFAQVFDDAARALRS